MTSKPQDDSQPHSATRDAELEKTTRPPLANPLDGAAVPQPSKKPSKILKRSKPANVPAQKVANAPESPQGRAQSSEPPQKSSEQPTEGRRRPRVFRDPSTGHILPSVTEVALVTEAKGKHGLSPGEQVVLLRTPCPKEMADAGLQREWCVLLRAARKGDRAALYKVLELSGANKAIEDRLTRAPTPGVAPEAGEATPPGKVLTDRDIVNQLAKTVGSEITEEARGLVAELDMAIGEILRRKRLGLPLSPLEALVAEHAENVCTLERIEILDTPSGQHMRRREESDEG